jgi:hypothetical protein
MTKAPLLNVGNGGLTPHFPPVIAGLLSPLSLRAERGNLGGV